MYGKRGRRAGVAYRWTTGCRRSRRRYTPSPACRREGALGAHSRAGRIIGCSASDALGKRIYQKCSDTTAEFLGEGGLALGHLEVSFHLAHHRFRHLPVTACTLQHVFLFLLNFTRGVAQVGSLIYMRRYHRPRGSRTLLAYAQPRHVRFLRTLPDIDQGKEARRRLLPASARMNWDG